ncbi:ATP-grasp domain-containing protein [Streptomyces sp. NBC_00648]|uniref:ATP-grasp domain-containing protein n=1 Tax=Streptomyces sp. NBC_00648 TaxID=2975797 RepID=UPI003247A5F7
MPIQTINDRVAVVVDGHSTGALLAPAFTAYGIGAVHVENRAERSAAHLRTFAPETYEACYAYEGDLAALLAALRPHRVGWVIAGTDSGVALADRLAAALGLPRHNDPATSAARRDKQEMQRALAAAGVPAAWHAAVTTPEEAREVALRHGGAPVIVKPLRSGGTDGVLFCADPDETASAAEKLLGSESIYGERNETVLVQEYLRGDEYMVNCVSAAGHHTVLEIWRSVKTVVGTSPVYDYTELLNPRSQESAGVIAYVRDVLTSVGNTWGPSHTEVIATPSGPRLVETAARPQGTADLSAIARATGRNPVTETVHALLDPDLYARGGPPPPPQRAARGVSFICPRSGRLRRDLDWTPLHTLPSFHSLLAPAPKAGAYIPRTTDLFTRPGAVYLIHEDPKVVERDHATIRGWEGEGFYDIEEEGSGGAADAGGAPTRATTH